MKLSLAGNAPAASRKKLVIAALLGVVLLLVVVYPSGDTDDTSDTTAVSPPASQSDGETPARSAGNTTTQTAETPTTRLPPVNLQRVMAHNPFRSEPAAGNTGLWGNLTTLRDLFTGDEQPPEEEVVAADPEPTIHDPTPPAPPVLNITGIVTGGARPAALIGERLFYERDELADGWRIIAIRARSIVLEPPGQR